MKKFEIKVPGTDFILRSNSIYYVQERPDSSAPMEMVKRGMSKLPLRTNGESIMAPYDVKREIWNTGFYEQSKCYSNLPKSEVTEILKELKNNLLKEIKPLIPEGLEDYKKSNNSYFDSFGKIFENSKYTLLKGNTFNTKDPIAMLALWWALIGGQAAPEGTKGNPKYNDVKFEIVDRYKNTTKEQDDNYDILDANANMLSILKKGTKKEKTHTENILKYLNYELDLSNDQDKKVTLQVFSGWLNRGLPGQNARAFNKAMEEFDTKEGQEYIKLYVNLDSLIRAKKIEVRRKDIFLDGENLGSDKKQATKVIQDSKELTAALLSL